MVKEDFGGKQDRVGSWSGAAVVSSAGEKMAPRQWGTVGVEMSLLFKNDILEVNDA